jgi:2-keto-4-pentenoate hydratase
VREALDALRVRGERVRMGDLVIRGARERLRELEAEREDEAHRAELRRQLVAQLHTGEGLDAEAAYEVREHGWIHR